MALGAKSTALTNIPDLLKNMDQIPTPQSKSKTDFTLYL